MNRFKYAVRRRMQSEGWSVHEITHGIVDFLCYRHGKVKLIRAKPHAHIYRAERKALCKLGKDFGVHILYAYEAQGHELVFKRIYP